MVDLSALDLEEPGFSQSLDPVFNFEKGCAKGKFQGIRLEWSPQLTSQDFLHLRCQRHRVGVLPAAAHRVSQPRGTWRVNSVALAPPSRTPLEQQPRQDTRRHDQHNDDAPRR